MTKSSFRKILILYATICLVMGAIGGYSGYLINQSIPEIQKSMANDKDYHKQITDSIDSTLILADDIVNYIAITLAVVSWVGLFLFWSPARIIYAFNLIPTYIISPVLSSKIKEAWNTDPVLADLSDLIHTAPIELWSQISSSALSFVDGAIVIIIFTKLGSGLFEKDNAQRYLGSE